MIFWFLITPSFLVLQYLKRLHVTTHHLLERFALLLCIAIIWAFAAILTVSGAYSTAKGRTQQSCRTDRSFLLSSAPWCVLMLAPFISDKSKIYLDFLDECLQNNKELRPWENGGFMWTMTIKLVRDRA